MGVLFYLLIVYIGFVLAATSVTIIAVASYGIPFAKIAFVATLMCYYLKSYAVLQRYNFALLVFFHRLFVLGVRLLVAWRRLRREIVPINCESVYTCVCDHILL